MSKVTYKVVLLEVNKHESVLYERTAIDDKSDFVYSHAAETVAWSYRNKDTRYERKRTKDSITHVISY